MFRRTPPVRSHLKTDQSRRRTNGRRDEADPMVDLPAVHLERPRINASKATAPVEHGGTRGALSLRLAEEWSLVLQARGIEHAVRRHTAGWAVSVPESLLETALREISLFERENQPHRMVRLRREFIGNTRLTLLLLSLLLLFHACSGLILPGLDIYPHTWVARGSADSARILSGEWWRLATALTLHGDIAHLGGNLIVGGVFIVFVCRETGSGLGWLLVILSGILGNLTNALAHGAGHDSVGFSTAVFGAAGILGGLRTVLGPFFSSRLRTRRWMPIAAAFGLFALLGLGGERTDVGAHVFGFLWGALFGLGIGFFLMHRIMRIQHAPTSDGKATRANPAPSAPWQICLGTLSLLLMVGAWVAALGVV